MARDNSINKRYSKLEKEKLIAIIKKRIKVYEAARELHPQRFNSGIRKCESPKGEYGFSNEIINPFILLDNYLSITFSVKIFPFVIIYGFIPVFKNVLLLSSNNLSPKTKGSPPENLKEILDV